MSDAYEIEQQRIRLIEAVERETMTLEAAESEAQRLGLGGLIPEIPLEDFDPMAQSRWSLVMALVWVLGRNPRAVRNSWNDFVSTQYRWERLVGSMGPPRLKKRIPQWANEVHASRVAEFAFFALPGRSFPVSWAMLRAALARGQVAAWGRDLRKGELSDVAAIPESNWDALQLGEMPTDAPAGGAPGQLGVLLGATMHAGGEDMLHFGNGVPVYVSITVERKGLLEAFPPLDGSEAFNAAANDPLQQLADSVARAERPAEYKRRIRLQAIRSRFPEGVPKAMTKKTRDRELEKAVLAVDKTIGMASAREWGRLCDLVFPPNKNVVQ